MNTPASTLTRLESKIGSGLPADVSELLLAKARQCAQAGRMREAFQSATEALLMRPGDKGILAFIAGLNLPKNPPPAAPTAPQPVKRTAPQTLFDALPLVQHVRELRQITGGSVGCGWMNDELALMVYSLVKWFKPELVVQTGHLWGKSALVVLESLNDEFLTPASPLETEPMDADRHFTKFRNSNRPPQAVDCKFISVDPDPSEVPHSDEGINFIKGLHPNFEFYKMMSTDFFDEHGEHLARDYAHQRILGIVDGDHTYRGCVLDMEAFARLGARMILVDDTMWLPYISRAAKVFAKRNHYQYLDLTWYNGMGILFKEGDSMPTIHPRPSGFSFRMGLAHALYRLGGLRLMKLSGLPRE